MPNFKILFIFCIIGSCSTAPSDSPASPRTSKFFDLTGYMQSEAQRLNLNGTKVEKILSVNDQTDTIYPTEFNFQSQLAIFEKANINKIAWEDLYTIDSTIDYIRYTAQEPSLEVKTLQINKDENGEITHPAFETKIAAFLSSFLGFAARF